MPPLAQSVLEHIRFLHLPDGRVVVVLISAGGVDARQDGSPGARIHPGAARHDSQLSEYATTSAGRSKRSVPTCCKNWPRERERYATSAARRRWSCAIRRCSKAPSGRQVYLEGAAQIASAPRTFHRRRRAAAGTSGGHRGKEQAGRAAGRLHRSARAGAYPDRREGDQFGGRTSLVDHRAAMPFATRRKGSLGVLGPTRMQYERAITAVAFMARAFSESCCSRSSDSDYERMTTQSMERQPMRRNRRPNRMISGADPTTRCRSWPRTWPACRPKKMS